TASVSLRPSRWKRSASSAMCASTSAEKSACLRPRLRVNILPKYSSARVRCQPEIGVAYLRRMKIVSSKEVLKNKLFTVVDEIAHDPSGFEIHRNIVRHPGSAVMLAVDPQQRILLVKQFRLPAEQELWELPAGRVDPGESSLEAAKRELSEETGYSAKTWS